VVLVVNEESRWPIYTTVSEQRGEAKKARTGGGQKGERGRLGAGTATSFYRPNESVEGIHEGTRICAAAACATHMKNSCGRRAAWLLARWPE
jgi:hypothetical protein